MAVRQKGAWPLYSLRDCHDVELADAGLIAATPGNVTKPPGGVLATATLLADAPQCRERGKPVRVSWTPMLASNSEIY